MWQIIRDIKDLRKEEQYRELITVEDLSRQKAKRYKKEVYRKMIYNYLRKYHKGIDMLSREDIAIMTE